MTRPVLVRIVRGLLLPMLMLGSTLTSEAEAATVTIDPAGYLGTYDILDNPITQVIVPLTSGLSASTLVDGDYLIRLGNFPGIPFSLVGGTVTLAAAQTRAVTTGSTITFVTTGVPSLNPFATAVLGGLLGLVCVQRLRSVRPRGAPPPHGTHGDLS